MTHIQTLTHHRDIQDWVQARKGTPAMAGGSSRFGALRPTLVLKFDHQGRPEGMPSVDAGASPVSWHAWLAELDRQELALRVSEDGETSYELIERNSLN